ncbi:MAG TPA: glycosyltransferase family 9 protein [Candidatus Methylacidiphilales bacterium]|nr:glycosyltransferase family 9 protein [Candidatus Methylacidiphilales bacterium]
MLTLQVKLFSSKVALLQAIDYRVGVPVCWTLTWLRRAASLGRFFRPENSRKDEPLKKILFVKLAEQGSTVLAYDAFKTAGKKVGRENVYLLVFEENRFIADLLELIPRENVLTIETESAFAMVASSWRCLRYIRRLKIDACVDMEFFSRLPAAFAFLTGAKRRVGYHTYFGEGPYLGDLFTHRVLYNSHLHASTSFSSLVHALDADPTQFPTFAQAPPPSQAPPLFCPGQDEMRQVEEILAREGRAPGERMIVLNANASDLLPLRRWDGKNYIMLAKRLLEKFPEMRIVFSGSGAEQAVISDLVREVDSKRCRCLAGQTTLRQLMILYRMSEILITNDSGPAHFAMLTGIDVLTLFGPETPRLFAPPGPRSHAIYLGLACSPCVNAYNNRQTACRNNICMKNITVDQVFETACRIYLERISVSQ